MGPLPCNLSLTSFPLRVEGSKSIPLSPQPCLRLQGWRFPWWEVPPIPALLGGPSSVELPLVIVLLHPVSEFPVDSILSWAFLPREDSNREGLLT